MWLRFTRLFMAMLLLVVVWGLTLVRQAPNQVWVHPLSAKPQPVRILRFYATTGSVVPGQSAQLCYSVENAKLIRISPAVDRAYPSLGRCLEIHPEHTTHYILQAEGFDGSIVTRSITLAVQDGPIGPVQVRHYA
jgi:hypothetical protein